MIPFHPLANLFPLIEGAEFEALVADVRENGIRERIVIHEGMILDGRNRYRAAVEADVLSASEEQLAMEKRFGSGAFFQTASQFAAFSLVRQGDPLAWVLSKNLHRRHLTDSQRTAVAADLVVLRQGQRTDLSPSGEKSRTDGLSKPEAAEALHVSERSIERQLGVKRDGAPELVDAVRQGQVTVATAESIAKLPVTKQLEVLRSADPRALSRIAREQRELRTAEKKERRAEREAELGARQRALPNKRYGVILADPEWQFGTWSEGGMDRAADNHYPTSPLEAIKARDVGSIAADDAVLLLWATAPMLPQALEVVAAWGFTYKSQFVWLKDVAGTGYWNRNQHEILILATRGEVPAPAPGTQFRSALAWPVGAHSEKPPFAHELAEAYFPSLPKIELNARARRDGWDAWGLEAPEDSDHPDIPESSTAARMDVLDNRTGEGVRDELADQAAASTPPAGTQAPPVDSDPLNAAIRAGYARNASIAELVAATGLSRDAVMSRAKRMQLGDRDRQRAAVAEANRRRGQPAGVRQDQPAGARQDQPADDAEVTP